MSKGDLSFSAVKSLEGQLLTLIEATHADETQRESLKSIIRTTVWNWQRKWIKDEEVVTPSYDDNLNHNNPSTDKQ